jgi:hypothetical protein
VGFATVSCLLGILKEFCKRGFCKLKLWQGRKVEQGFYKFRVDQFRPISSGQSVQANQFRPISSGQSVQANQFRPISSGQQQLTTGKRKGA